MKLIGRLLTTLLGLSVVLGGSVFAQNSTSAIRVKIPFEFNVGDQTFPAGDYSLVQPLQHFVALRDARGRTVASALTNSIDSSAPVTTPKLRFATIDGQYFLTELWQEQEPAGQRLLINSTPRTSLAKRHSDEAMEAAQGSQP